MVKSTVEGPREVSNRYWEDSFKNQLRDWRKRLILMWSAQVMASLSEKTMQCIGKSMNLISNFDETSSLPSWDHRHAPLKSENLIFPLLNILLLSFAIVFCCSRVENCTRKFLFSKKLKFQVEKKIMLFFHYYLFNIIRTTRAHKKYDK